ncbi:hypothetical protein, variant [Aphanomyces invadans]|uniref:Endonuclease/exonuclease/phosphatase domain-containing protein n=1 Tax=Aphanomyces invadans TaxID=157072 RepID=A0A024U5V5_9STRA|nr:hypothetical protein, variant [Aphanomyces invadans]ETW00968.1 hypothetical protein, variant [Aphanomyces invadans]|eukprot:XP_008869966.1 hypothetical protein, variant [Aphanomyces invadans]
MSTLADVSMLVDEMEEGDDDIPTASTGVTFTLMTYNVLAQCYVKSSFFPYCDPKALRWKRRSAMLIGQIKAFSPRPDILCLQECDQYDTFWQSQMAAIGYTSLYLKKTGTKKDGVGLFWRPEKFTVLGGENVALNEALHSVTDKDLRGRVIRDNVGLVAHFQSIENPATEFVVASTHLFWDPAQADVKLVQAKHMLDSIDAFVATSLPAASVPVFFAGDFNSLPDSAVVRHVLSRGFASAYSTYNAETGEPRFTNVNGVVHKMNENGHVVGTEPAFVGTLDYIFYHKSKVKVQELLPLMDYETAVRDGGALPNRSVGSDHLPLMATFVFK